jgi:hypothetical protein
MVETKPVFQNLLAMLIAENIEAGFSLRASAKPSIDRYDPDEATNSFPPN